MFASITYLYGMVKYDTKPYFIGYVNGFPSWDNEITTAASTSLTVTTFENNCATSTSMTFIAP